MNGFLGFVGVTVGKRMMTISAWENAKDPRQLLAGGGHADAMKKFFGTELAAGGFTSVWVPDRINTRWVRCGCVPSHDGSRAERWDVLLRDEAARAASILVIVIGEQAEAVVSSKSLTARARSSVG